MSQVPCNTLHFACNMSHVTLIMSYNFQKTEEDFIFARVTPETLNKIVGKLKTKNSSGNDNNISTKLLNSAIINQSTLF